jgi:hypothetical protein
LKLINLQNPKKKRRSLNNIDDCWYLNHIFTKFKKNSLIDYFEINKFAKPEKEKKIIKQYR